MSSRKVFILTLGCRLNQAESLKLKGLAAEKGFTVVSNGSEADIFVLNSCSVTDKAQRDTEKILRKFHERYPDKTLVVTGCGARKEHEKYGKVVKNEDKENLFSSVSFRTRSGIHKKKNWILNQVQNDNIVNKEQKTYSPTSVIPAQVEIYKTRLMYKVQDGCNNFCSYCIVPYLRGREKSKSVDDIIAELKTAENQGFKEIVLCGVNIGRYSSSTRSNLVQGSTLLSKDIKLAGLIEKIIENTMFPRIRLSSINPDDFSDDLVDLWAKNSRLCPHFHVSLQSGSDTVLQRMGRKYSTKQYAGLVAKLRSKIKDVQITTDIIVGFPGETEAEFAETLEFLEKMQLLKVHVFRYSKREGTRAEKMSEQISEAVKKERAFKLQNLESDIRKKILRSYVGKEVEVLFEQKKNEHYSGFTPNYIKVSKEGDKSLTNKIVKVKITGSTANKLLA